MTLKGLSLITKTFILAAIVLSAPLQAGIVVLNGLSHEHFLGPTESEQGVIRIKNDGANAEMITVYQKDFKFNYKGQTFYNDPSSQERSNAKWLVINPLSLLLGPSEEAEIVYNVAVPNNDSLFGSYWSSIMIEPVNDFDTTKPKAGLSVRSVFRYAIQIITHVKDTNSVSKLEFLDVQLIKENESNYLMVDAENTGSRMLRTKMAIEIFNANGESQGVFTSIKSRTYPGTSKRYIIPLKDVPAGSYEAVLIADSENDEVFGIQMTLDISDD